MNMFGGLAFQMPGMSWHDGGLFMGMHWIWWGFWLVLFAVLGLAFWRLLSDRAETRRSVATEEQAEEALRRRFAKGEIDEDEYARKLKVLRESMLGR
jgi:putative membrane protein